MTGNFGGADPRIAELRAAGWVGQQELGLILELSSDRTAGGALPPRRRGDTMLMRPEVPATDILTGRRIKPGPIRLAKLLAQYPGAPLVDAR